MKRRKIIAVILCIMLVIMNLNIGSYNMLSYVDAEEMHSETDATISDAFETNISEDDAVESETAFSSSQTVGNVTISVIADEGVFPSGSTLSVRSVTNSEENAISNAVNIAEVSNYNVASSYTFDIKVLDADGTEIEPDNSKGNVKVSFAMSEVANANLETNVWHIEGEVGSLDAEKLNASEEGTTVIADTTGFSYYQVEFTYGEKQYVLHGDESVKLTDILSYVGITNADGSVATDNSITSAIGSDDSLFTVKKENDVWMATAVTAFCSSENLVVTVDGTEYEIVVTDDHTHNDKEFIEWDSNNSLPTEAGNYYLTKDVTINGTWAVRGETSLCLNGHSITNNGNGTVISVNGNRQLNLYDCSGDEGKITGGRALNGGGVKVDKGYSFETPGIFNMYGGTISNNTAYFDNGGGYGAGVYNYGTFNLYGGIITNNLAEGSGGGVYNYVGIFNMYDGMISNNKAASSGGGVVTYHNNTNIVSFNMNGGTITNNEVTSSNRGGDGVYFQMGKFVVSGNPVISGNKKNNVFLSRGIVDGTKITVGQLESDASIGVTIGNEKGSGGKGVFSIGGSAYAENFTSDNLNFGVLVEGDDLKIDQYVNITEVTLNKNTIEDLIIGNSDSSLVATVKPDNASNKTVKWVSNNTDVATVDSTGKITAVGVGTAIITVTATNGTAATDDDKTANCTVTVKKGTMDVTSEGWTGTYDGEAHGIVVNVSKPTSGYTITYGTTSETYDLSQCPTITDVNDGQLKVYYKVTAPNYNDVTGSETVIISKADSTLTKTPTAKTGLKYTDENQDLINAGSTNDGELQYSLDGTNYSTSIPQGKKVQEYTVYYKVVGDSNHNDSDPVSLTVSISEVNKEELDNIITTATTYYNSIITDYISIADELLTAITKAQGVYNNPDQTAGQVSAAVSELEDALDKAHADVVMEIISNLPEPEDVTTENKDIIDAAREAYEALTNEQKAKVSSAAKEKLEAVEAALLNKTKEAAKTSLKTIYDNMVTSGDYDEDGLIELEEAYNTAVNAIIASTVSDTKTAPEDSGVWKAEIAGEDALDEVKTAAEKVTELIDELPTPDNITTGNKEDIEEAREAYDALTDHQKEQIEDTILQKLEDDEIALVKAIIEALPTPENVVTGDKDAIDEAREAYNSLTPTQQTKVTNIQKLLEDEAALLERTKDAAKEELEKKYGELVESGDYDEDGLIELEEAYKDAIDAIDASTVTDTKTDPLDNGPWNAEKSGVDSLGTVKTAADKVTEIINALPKPDDVSTGDKDAIEKAREAYESLTDDQKKQVSDDIKEKLENDEAALLERTKDAAKEELKKKYDDLVKNGDYDENGLNKLKKAYEDAIAAIDAATVTDTKDAPSDNGPWGAEVAGIENLDVVKSVEVKYTNTEGSGSSWYKGTTKGNTFIFKRNINDNKTFAAFTGVMVDGKTVSKDKYTAEAGSVIITLKPEYLETLSVGEHTLTAQFTDADDVTVKFSVLEKSSTTTPETKVDTPDKGADKNRKSANTGDNMNVGLIITLMILSILSILFIVIRKRRDNF